MNAEDFKRKLTAILSADVAGYSRLMDDNEEATVRTLNSYRSTMSDLVQLYRGRVVDAIGDNLMAEFNSVVDAVNCAIEIQRELGERNKSLEDNRKMEFRIGVNLGDVIEEGGRIYGDGVNIAARVESLAEPGGICISGRAYDHVENKLRLGYDFLGEHAVKNIKRPIRIYKIPNESKRVTMEEKVKGPSSKIEKPSIAVLPFANMSNDPDQQYFSDGMAEEIINGLAKNPGLIVKGRTSSFSDKVKNQDIKTIGELLDVTHIVEGSVRKSGDRIRITAQLIDTGDDLHIWSDKYDRELTDVFEIQDDIADAILKELNIHLLRPLEKIERTENLEAYNAYLLGRYQFNRDHLEDAVVAFEQAISADHDYADAYGALAAAQFDFIWSDRASPKVKLPLVQQLVKQALAISPKQTDALTIQASNIFFLDRQYQKAINEFNNLIKLHPNDWYLLMMYSHILRVIGRFDIALKADEHMVKLDPLNGWVHHHTYLNFSAGGNYDKALEALNQADRFGYPVSFQRCYMALAKKDIEGITDQLEKVGTEYAYIPSAKEFAKSFIAILNGDYGKARKIVAPLQEIADISYWNRWNLALAAGEIDHAVECLTRGIEENEYLCFASIHGFIGYRETFPDFFSNSEFQKMLRDSGLDRESVSNLKIPPLPF